MLHRLAFFSAVVQRRSCAEDARPESLQGESGDGVASLIEAASGLGVLIEAGAVTQARVACQGEGVTRRKPEPQRHGATREKVTKRGAEWKESRLLRRATRVAVDERAAPAWEIGRGGQGTALEPEGCEGRQ